MASGESEPLQAPGDSASAPAAAPWCADLVENNSYISC
jgi:hypothetical protein